MKRSPSLREGLPTKDPFIPDDSSPQTPGRFAGTLPPVDLSRNCVEGGAECRGPSLAFVPLRGTKDYAQDDSPVVQELMNGCLLQTDPLPV